MELDALTDLFCAVEHEHKERTGHVPSERRLAFPLCLVCLHLNACADKLVKANDEAQREERPQ